MALYEDPRRGVAQPSSLCFGIDEDLVCWTRMQSEAGQALEAIVDRKERERRAGRGVFFWGVGNPPAQITNTIARARIPVRAVFSIMKSRPKAIDVVPSRVFLWRRYIDMTGAMRELPETAFVTSRGDSPNGKKRSHYALICRSEEPLKIKRGEAFDPSAFRNVGGTGAGVGFSQVTALLKRTKEGIAKGDYEVNMTAWLEDSYWVKLADPVQLNEAEINAMSRLFEKPLEDWLSFRAQLQGKPSVCGPTSATLL